ncbi:MAG: hypothetical protein ACRD4U_05050 [Candidatus Acidiferrales bacterium]
MKKLAALLVIATALIAAPLSYAQGCIMCRTSAAAGGADAAKTFDLAILVLLIPTISIFVGILVFAFRRRNRQAEEPPEEALPWPENPPPKLSASKPY